MVTSGSAGLPALNGTGILQVAPLPLMIQWVDDGQLPLHKRRFIKWKLLHIEDCHPTAEAFQTLTISVGSTHSIVVDSWRCGEHVPIGFHSFWQVTREPQELTLATSYSYATGEKATHSWKDYSWWVLTASLRNSSPVSWNTAILQHRKHWSSDLLARLFTWFSLTEIISTHQCHRAVLQLDA